MKSVLYNFCLTKLRLTVILDDRRKSCNVNISYAWLTHYQVERSVQPFPNYGRLLLFYDYDYYISQKFWDWKHVGPCHALLYLCFSDKPTTIFFSPVPPRTDSTDSDVIKAWFIQADVMFILTIFHNQLTASTCFLCSTLLRPTVGLCTLTFSFNILHESTRWERACWCAFSWPATLRGSVSSAADMCMGPNGRSTIPLDPRVSHRVGSMILLDPTPKF